jgi:hypothetical protein
MPSGIIVERFYANLNVCWYAAGLQRDGVVRRSFWDVFQLKLKNTSGMPNGVQETAQQNKEFTINGVFLAAEPLSSASDGSRPRAPVYSMGFRCETPIVYALAGVASLWLGDYSTLHIH